MRGEVIHDGGRIKFGPDGDLYITCGDSSVRELAQDLTSLNGKIDSLIGIYHREVDLYGSLLVVAYKVIVVDDAITINHELFDAGFYPHHLIPEVRIPLHLQIIKDAALQLPLQR